jgi:plasmid stabilization system protein ParE
MLQGEPALRLRVGALTDADALTGYIRSGAYRRAASIARELARTLEELADMEMRNDGPRSTLRPTPPERHRIARQVPSARPREAKRLPGPRIIIEEVKTE